MIGDIITEYADIVRANEAKWDARFLVLADHISTWSKDPRTKVGAVIVRPDRTIVSTGYNGFPRQIADTPELLNDRDAKYKRVIHAEMNAILTAKEPLRQCTIYTSLCPCERCATHIVQSGIDRVVAWKLSPAELERWAGKIDFDTAFQVFEEGGVMVTLVEA